MLMTQQSIWAYWRILKYCLLLQQYALATGGVTNFYKSERVLCGRWRNLAPNLGIKVAKSSKYLRVITRYDSSMAQKTITEREARIYRQIDTWDHKLSFSPIDKVMVAKIMCLSIAKLWVPTLSLTPHRHSRGPRSKQGSQTPCGK
jgi:hypothetical protein